MTNTYPIIGMSPGNSYFKDEVVTALLNKVVEQYGQTAVLIPDIPAIATYVALGYPKNIARREKALPQRNALRNKVQRAMDELEYSTAQVHIVDWEAEVESDPLYKEKYEIVSQLYKTNPAFQEAANAATRDVLEGAEKEISDIETAVQIAVHYLLSELAFMEFAPQHFQYKNVTYVYHRLWPVYERYISGEFDSVHRSGLSFTIVK